MQNQPAQIRTTLDGGVIIYRPGMRFIAHISRWIPGGYGAYATVREEWVSTQDEARDIIKSNVLEFQHWMITDLDAIDRIVESGCGPLEG